MTKSIYIKIESTWFLGMRRCFLSNCFLLVACRIIWASTRQWMSVAEQMWRQWYLSGGDRLLCSANASTILLSVLHRGLSGRSSGLTFSRVVNSEKAQSKQDEIHARRQRSLVSLTSNRQFSQEIHCREAAILLFCNIGVSVSATERTKVGL